MALALWVYPGPVSATLRLAQCVTPWCGLKYTDAAATATRCPNCGAWVAISADPT